LPEPTDENRFVAEHADQVDVVMPDGEKVSLGELWRHKQREQDRARRRPQIHVHYDKR
jgi:hypothetical protein